MADKSVPSLSEQYALPSEEKPVESKPLEVEEIETSPTPSSEEVADEKVLEASAAVKEISEAPAAASESSDVVPADNAVQESSDESAPATEESNEEESATSEDANEETPEVKLETAPADFRFPTTNQTRHCFTRYIEYHRCVGAKGEDASECDKFAKYYRSLCPGEWVDRWNEQRENGTFPGPL